MQADGGGVNQPKTAETGWTGRAGANHWWAHQSMFWPRVSM